MAQHRLLHNSSHRFLTHKEASPSKTLSRSRQCGESSSQFSASLPGAARPGSLPCCLPAGGIGTAHRWPVIPAWCPPGHPACPRWSHAQAGMPPVLRHTSVPPSCHSHSPHTWRWHQRHLFSMSSPSYIMSLDRAGRSCLLAYLQGQLCLSLHTRTTYFSITFYYAFAQLTQHRIQAWKVWAHAWCFKLVQGSTTAL